MKTKLITVVWISVSALLLVLWRDHLSVSAITMAILFGGMAGGASTGLLPKEEIS